MSNRELVIDLINKLPEDMPLKDIAREIEFVAGVKEAIAEADRGECVSAEEARRLIKVWTSKSS
jgi:predicted transcriptional regulator